VIEEIMKILPDISEEEKEAVLKILESEYEKGKQDAKSEYEKIDFDQALSSRLSDSGALCEKATIAVMDMENVVFENGEFLGLDEEIERVKAEYAFLFKQEVPHFSTGDGMEDEQDISALNYMERLRLFKENPDLYKLRMNK